MPIGRRRIVMSATADRRNPWRTRALQRPWRPIPITCPVEAFRETEWMAIVLMIVMDVEMIGVVALTIGVDVEMIVVALVVAAAAALTIVAVDVEMIAVGEDVMAIVADMVTIVVELMLAVIVLVDTAAINVVDMATNRAVATWTTF
jgi:hypothetical protein